MSQMHMAKLGSRCGPIAIVHVYIQLPYMPHRCIHVVRDHACETMLRILAFREHTHDGATGASPFARSNTHRGYF